MSPRLTLVLTLMIGVLASLGNCKPAKETVSCSHHAEGLVNPKVRAQKRLLVLDTPEHVDSESIKLKIGSRSLLYQLFSKRD
jgi:hypothetical protein